jgi:hypothetical protein
MTLRTRHISSFVSILTITAAAACGISPARSFPPIDPATVSHVLVLRSRDTVRVIQDVDSIRSLVAFVNDRRRGWGGLGDWAGVPVAQVSAELRGVPEREGAKSRPLGGFGAGPNFFEAHWLGGFSFASRGASKADLKEFAGLLGVRVEDFQPR